MAKIVPMDFIKSISGKVCQHSDSYFSANKSSGIIHTGKICNPFTGDPTESQQAVMTAFTTKAGYANTWLNANKPSATNGENGTSDYQLAQSLKKSLGLSNIRQVVYKYMNATTGVVTLPGSSSSSSSYTISLAASPAAGGSVSCGKSTATAGESVTITATPNEGYVFSKWSDDNTNATRSVTVNSNINLTAIFAED